VNGRTLVLVPFVVIAAACRRSAPAPVMTTVPPPSVSEPRLVTVPVERPPVTLSPALLAPVDSANEVRVQIDTQGRDVDVRTVLTWLGDAAGLRFAFSPDINKKIRITLVDVPVSQAIQTVLSMASLTLEGATAPQRPSNASVVFYQLPVNVDSLSVDAIMKRFGVSRAMAELLVRERRP
jgi:hypothetical protein